MYKLHASRLPQYLLLPALASQTAIMFTVHLSMASQFDENKHGKHNFFKYTFSFCPSLDKHYRSVMSYGIIAQIAAMIFYTAVFGFDAGRRYAGAIGKDKEKTFNLLAFVQVLSSTKLSYAYI